MSARTDPATEQRIIEMRGRGVALKRIAAEVGLSPTTVTTVLVRAGLHERRAPQNRDAEILPLLDEGLTYGVIADRLGVSTATVHKAAKRAGRPVTTRREWTPTEDATLTDRYEHGHPLVKIARLLDRPESTVQARVQALGLTRERTRRAEHGRPACWQTGCTHPVCVEARREYKADEYRRAREQADFERLPHGVPRTYALGCRCAACTAAGTAYLVERQERTRDKAHSQGGRWTGQDIDMAMRDDLPLERIADELGRTYAAVSNVRKAIADPASPAHERYMALWDEYRHAR